MTQSKLTEYKYLGSRYDYIRYYGTWCFAIFAFLKKFSTVFNQKYKQSISTFRQTS